MPDEELLRCREAQARREAGVRKYWSQDNGMDIQEQNMRLFSQAEKTRTHKGSFCEIERRVNRLEQVCLQTLLSQFLRNRAQIDQRQEQVQVWINKPARAGRHV